MSEHLFVTAIFKAKPDCIDRLTEVLSELAPPSRAEPGCIEYHFYQDTETPTTIFAFETWRNADDLVKHAASAHFQAAAAQLGELLTDPLAIHKTKRII